MHLRPLQEPGLRAACVRQRPALQSHRLALLLLHCAHFAPSPARTRHLRSCSVAREQPFCDGSHKGTEFTPMPWTAEESGTKYFCGCKLSGNKPFCDGKHRGLPADAVGKAFAKDYVPPPPA